MPGVDLIAADIESDGFHLARPIYSPRDISDLIGACERSVSSSAPHGARNLIERMPELRPLCEAGPLAAHVRRVLGENAACVRSILFDKTPEANWKVPFHQDRSIAVRRRVEVGGFGPWSVKEQVPHVQPPRQILENMLTARIHLDDCGIGNGPLRVVPGSHRSGILTESRIEQSRDLAVPVIARAGDVLFMRPLLLHASSAAAVPSHRRVIHLEFAGSALPGGLEWRNY